jgi:hypothetical protein
MPRAIGAHSFHLHSVEETKPLRRRNAIFGFFSETVRVEVEETKPLRRRNAILHGEHFAGVAYRRRNKASSQA